MSVLIKGMKMPNVCDCCWALDESGDYPMCRITGETRGYNFRVREKRMDRCPLIELPDHGDLIDRDALYERTAEWEAQALHMCEMTMHDEDKSEWKRWSTILTERSAFKFDVADATTVIPAERSEE